MIIIRVFSRHLVFCAWASGLRPEVPLRLGLFEDRSLEGACVRAAKTAQRIRTHQADLSGQIVQQETAVFCWQEAETARESAQRPSGRENLSKLLDEAELRSRGRFLRGRKFKRLNFKQIGFVVDPCHVVLKSKR